MQRFLEANPRILIQLLVAGRSAWVIPKKRLGSEHETDFVIRQKASGTFEWYAVELERPQAKMFNKNGDPSAALTHALRQISDWREWLSQNRDYATKPREQSGLGLTGIDPELEGLIIIGRDADIDRRATASLRRRLERTHRTKIETYDWLLSQASERLEVLEKRAKSMAAAVRKTDPVTELMGALFSTRLPEKPTKKAVKEVFGGIWTGSANASVVRGEMEWEGVEIWPGTDFDNNVIVPVQIVYEQGMPADKLLHPGDWNEWIDHVNRNLDAQHSLLVAEIGPAESLQEILTLETNGIWYASEWYDWGDGRQFSHFDVLVSLPQGIGFDEKRSRVAVAREVFRRHIPDPAVEREERLKREKEAELKVIALSLGPGDSVIHNMYGLGTVVSLSGSGAHTDAQIDFGTEFGVKTLVLAYAPLKKVR